jgi:flagellar basal-body rod protein FlgB
VLPEFARECPHLRHGRQSGLNSESRAADSLNMETQLSGVGVLAQLMDAAALRHRVLAQNVANVNTPGYTRREVAFEADLAKALAAPNGAAPPVKPTVTVDETAPERVDGNNVDIDKEMGAISKNALLFQAAAQIVASRVASLRAAIAGR